MTRAETIKILSVLRASYPAFYSKVTDEDAAQTVLIWEDMFSGDDYRIVAAAVKAVINSDTSGFPPNIGTIKEQMRRFVAPEADTAMDAWNQVRAAISFYDARRNFNRLPELARRIVGSPNQLRDWAIMKAEDVSTVVQSNFLKAYRAKEKAYLAQKALPGDVKQLVTKLQEGMDLNGIDGQKANELEAEAQSGQTRQIAAAGYNTGT